MPKYTEFVYYCCNIFSVVKGIAKYAEMYRILIYHLNPVKSRKENNIEQHPCHAPVKIMNTFLLRQKHVENRRSRHFFPAVLSATHDQLRHAEVLSHGVHSDTSESSSPDVAPSSVLTPHEAPAAAVR